MPRGTGRGKSALTSLMTGRCAGGAPPGGLGGRSPLHRNGAPGASTASRRLARRAIGKCSPGPQPRYKRGVPPRLNLEGAPMAAARVALITGSGKRRLGWSVAEGLARRGYALAIHYRTSATDAAEAAALFRAQGVAADAFQADLTDEQAAAALIRATLERFGRLDVLVNCAAVWEPKRLEDVTAADVR